MILYNNRKRGPFEYDKFALNILSFHNIVNSLETVEVMGTKEELATLYSIKEEVDKSFNLIVGEEGISEKSYLLLLKERKCINL